MQSISFAVVERTLQREPGTALTDTMRINAKNAMLFALTLISIWRGLPAFGNDGAASVGVGGIQLKREARISMEKERLTVAREKVTVEYEFLNSTDEDITTEVAFPVPPYDETYLDASFHKRLDDFRVWVEERETKYETDVKAMLNGVDYSELLRNMGVDVVSLGHFVFSDKRYDPTHRMSRNCPQRSATS